MRNLKRVLSLALALVMVLGMMVITTSAATFDDADEITNVEDVEVMYALGIVQGDGTGNFDPDGTFTRAAAAKILTYMVLGADTASKLAGECNFEDVNSNPAYAWAAPYVAYCNNLGYIVGNGDGTFNPGGVLTDIELGKLVLCALGYDAAKYTGANWASAVTVDLIQEGLVSNVTGTAISREDACTMAMTAMKWSNSPVVYQVGEFTFDNLNDAVMFKAIVGGDIKPIQPKDTLLKTVHKVTYGATADKFGRDTVTYAADNGAWELVYSTAVANKTYTDAAKATDVEKDLKGLTLGTYKVADDTAAKILWHNGVNKTVKPSEVAGYTADNSVVELYIKDGDITKIVAVDYIYDVVTKVEPAKDDAKAYIMLETRGKYETDAEYAVGDVVMYTVVDSKIVTIEKLESFTGTISTYNKDGEYTINGTAYELSDAALVAAEALKAKLGKEMVYTIGLNNKIVAMASIAGQVVTINDYAYVVGCDVEVKPETKYDETTTTVKAADVKVVLSDGTEKVFDLAVSDKLVVEVNSVKYDLNKAADVDALKAALAKGTIYTYTLDGNTIDLVEKVTAKTNNNTISAKTDPVVSTADGAYLINADTTFILCDEDGKIVVKKGQAALAGTTIDAGDAKIIGKTEGTGADKTNVVDVVFAPELEFAAVDAKASNDQIIYVGGDYTVSLNEKNVTVYTYEGVKADGSIVAVTGDIDLPAGVYTYKNGKIDESVKTELEVTVNAGVKVNAVSGTTYQLGSKYVTIGEDIAVVAVAKDSALVKGATIDYVVDEDSNILVIYVVAAATKA